MADQLLDAEQRDKRGSFIGDFARGFIHTGLESPVNAITQTVNKVTGAEIPELQLVDMPKESSLAATAGSVIGGAIDYVLLSKVMGPALGKLGGAGTTGAVLRSGIVGGVYSGLLSPSDSKSDTFFKDRLSNGLVGAATFASMSAAGAKLDGTGLFRVPELRTLGGSLAMGGLTGAAGGVAHAEANALFNQGSLLPNMQDVMGDAAQYALFGATMSAMNWGIGKAMTQLETKKIDAQIPTKNGPVEGTVKYTTNANGEIIQMRADLPDRTFPNSTRVGWESTKMSNGSWTNQGYEIFGSRWSKVSANDLYIPPVKDIQLNADKALVITRDNGEILTFGKTMEKSNPEAEARAAKVKAELAERYDSTEYSKIDGTKTVVFEPPKVEGQVVKGAAYIEMDKAGSVTQISLHTQDGKSLMVSKAPDNSFKVVEFSKGGKETVSSEYSWKGQISSKTGANGKVAELTFKPESGTETVVQKQATNLSQLFSDLKGTSKYTGIYSGDNYIRLDDAGKIFLKYGAAEKPINVGDPLTFKYDVGDRYPVIKTVEMHWSKALDGKTFEINGRQLKPGSVLNLEVFRPAWE